MGRSDWTYLNIPVGVAAEIDKIVQQAEDYGVKKYRGRTDFTVVAVQRLLVWEARRSAKTRARESEGTR